MTRSSKAQFADLYEFIEAVRQLGVRRVAGQGIEVEFHRDQEVIDSIAQSPAEVTGETVEATPPDMLFWSAPDQAIDPGKPEVPPHADKPD